MRKRMWLSVFVMLSMGIFSLSVKTSLAGTVDLPKTGQTTSYPLVMTAPFNGAWHDLLPDLRTTGTVR